MGSGVFLAIEIKRGRFPYSLELPPYTSLRFVLLFLLASSYSLLFLWSPGTYHGKWNFCPLQFLPWTGAQMLCPHLSPCCPLSPLGDAMVTVNEVPISALVLAQFFFTWSSQPVKGIYSDFVAVVALILKAYLVLCVVLCVGGCAHDKGCVWRWRSNLLESVSSFHGGCRVDKLRSAALEEALFPAEPSDQPILFFFLNCSLVVFLIFFRLFHYVAQASLKIGILLLPPDKHHHA